MIFIKALRTIVDRLTLTLLTIGAFFGGTAAVLATINAICRKLISISFPWAEELCTYMIVIAVFLAIPYLELRNKQLCIDILSSSIKNKYVKRLLYTLGGLIIIFLSFVIVRYGFASTVTAYQTHTTTYVLQWPRAIFFGIGVACFAISILTWVALFILKRGEKFE